MLFQQLVNGITQGATYSLIAIGYALIFGVLGLVQFSHGDVYMIGAYCAHVYLGMGIAVGTISNKLIFSIIIAIIGSAILGIIIERVCFRPLRFASPNSSVLATIGFSFILREVGRLLFGAQTNRFIADKTWVSYYHIGDISVSNIQIIIIAVSLFLILGLQFILYRTNTGRAIRALSQNHMAAKLMGIDVDYIIMTTFAIGSALGGAAGALVGLYYNAVYPMMGAMAGIKAYAATVLGGLSSIPGAALGGIILGVAENLGSSFVNASWRDGIAFLIFFIMMIIRPTGLFGGNTGGDKV